MNQQVQSESKELKKPEQAIDKNEGNDLKDMFERRVKEMNT